MQRKTTSVKIPRVTNSKDLLNKLNKMDPGNIIILDEARVYPKGFFKKLKKKIVKKKMEKDLERDMESVHSELKKYIQKTYSPSPLQRISEIAGNLGKFIAILIYIIFRPLTIIAGGIVAIAMILLLRFL